MIIKNKSFGVPHPGKLLFLILTIPNKSLSVFLAKANASFFASPSQMWRQ